MVVMSQPRGAEKEPLPPSAEPSAACATCAHWKFDEPDWQFDKLSFGECKRIVQREDVVEPAREKARAEGRDAWDTEAEQEALLIAAKAFCVDGSGYYAALRTAPDFGCMLHEACVEDGTSSATDPLRDANT